jgi:N-methylhydantoinase A
MNELFQRMRTEAEEALGSQRSQLQHILLRYSLEMRYVGQTHEVTVEVISSSGPIDTVGQAELAATIDGFHNLHEQLYTFKKPQDEVEILNVHLDLIGIRLKPQLQTTPLGATNPHAAHKGKRPVYAISVLDYVETDIYDGDRITAGNVIEGPAVIEEKQTSIVILPGQRARLNEHLTYVIEVL